MFQHLLALMAREKQRKCRASFGLRLDGQRVMIRPPLLSDADDWLKLRNFSRNFLQPWEPGWPSDANTKNYYHSYWRRLMRRWVQDREYAFLIFHKQKNVLIGGVTITDVHRESIQAATLGTWMGAPFAGQGYMKEAAGMALEFAFAELQLHRIEASCMPENERSKSMLRSIGMREIGLSKQYMKINGVWRDHLLFERVRFEGS